MSFRSPEAVAKNKKRKAHHLKSRVEAEVFADNLEGQAIGYYSRGKLRNAAELPDETEGVLKLFPNKGRQYGTKDMVQLLIDSGLAIQEQFPQGERLQVGDISAKHGGRIRRHNSHQNGLDADLVYYRSDYFEQDPRGPGFFENFVKKGEITEIFDLERNWALFKVFAQSKKINRIFVDPAIKKALCQYAYDQDDVEGNHEVFKILRAWPHHANHMHVRLSCGVEDKNCREQRRPDDIKGCGEVEEKIALILKETELFNQDPSLNNSLATNASEEGDIESINENGEQTETISNGSQGQSDLGTIVLPQIEDLPVINNEHEYLATRLFGPQV